jgi:hypothetical protein
MILLNKTGTNHFVIGLPGLFLVLKRRINVYGMWKPRREKCDRLLCVLIIFVNAYIIVIVGNGI